MRKWSSNSNDILEQVPEHEKEFVAREILDDDIIKTLRVSWLPISDNFVFQRPEFNYNINLTKRKFLSEAAKLFDPLGWIAPAIIKPKIMFQELWRNDLQWDDMVPDHIATEWIQFRDNLHHLSQQIQNNQSVELHGFCDSSEKAYVAVVYVKSADSKGKTQINLILAKSRVTPVQSIPLPRLELCGGVLLANLIDVIAENLKIKKRYCWTDSSITLAWISSVLDKHKTFISNRISEIQSLTDVMEWRHVSSNDNPADCLSRGLDPEELKNHNLWWHGPQWLQETKENWPKNSNVKLPEDQLELKKVKSLVTFGVDFNDSLMEKFSSFMQSDSQNEKAIH